MGRNEQQQRTEDRDELRISVDAVNEMVLITAALVDAGIREQLVKKLVPEHFQAKEHRAIHEGLRELRRRGLDYDVAALEKVAKGIDTAYVQQLVAARPRPPTQENVDFHVSMLLWDHSRVSAARGPLAELLDALHDPKADPDRVRSLAKQLSETLATSGDLRFMRDPSRLVSEVITTLQSRRDGVASYPFGLKYLDYEERMRNGKPVRRLVPGAAPGKVTAIVGTPGSGKSTLAARLALGLAKQKRKVAYFAWEQNSPTTLETLTAMALGWPRSRLQEGDSPTSPGKLTEAELAEFRSSAALLARTVRFVDIPFNRFRKEKNVDNDRNLDVVQEYVEAAGCQVCIFDLWKRCLRYAKPEDEELALTRQQAMAEETRTHHVLVQQLRAKDVESREDKRPTREAIKGSGAWIEIPDTIIGVHRPGLWKSIEDNVIEVDVLKQRYGRWPIAVEFDWAPDEGTISGGRTVPYDSFTTTAQGDTTSGFLKDLTGKKGKGGRR